MSIHKIHDYKNITQKKTYTMDLQKLDIDVRIIPSTSKLNSICF